MKGFGVRLPRCSTHSFVKHVTPGLPADLAPLLGPVLEAIETLSSAIRGYDRQVAAMADANYPETKRLRQVPGVGPVTALTYILTLEDPHRFPSSRAVGSYLGLRPRQRDSGAAEPQLRITKAGMVPYGACWWAALITFWAPLDPTPTYAAGDSPWRSEAERRRRSAPS